MTDVPDCIRYSVPYSDNSGDRLEAKYTRDRDGAWRISCHVNGGDFCLESDDDIDWLFARIADIRAALKAMKQP
jgi:hypothetical protein